MVANLWDGYLSTQNDGPYVTVFMECEGDTESFECNGTWSGANLPAHATFALQDGQYVAKFKLPTGGNYGSKIYEAPCELKKKDF